MKGKNMLTKHTYTTSHGFTLRYFLYTPENASPDMPLFTFLHGAGEFGNTEEELDVILRNGLPRHIVSGALSLPSYAIFPQAPKGYVWSDLVIFLTELILHVADELKSDKKRLYLHGLSMGGYGTWSMAVANPNLFAAIAPVCGGGLSWAARTLLTNLPIHAYHGDVDSVVPVRNSVDMVDEINRFGGHATLTLFHGVDHNSWDPAYFETDMLSWLYQNRRDEDGYAGRN